MTFTDRIIYIENFPLDINDFVINDVFSTFGKIIRSDIPKFPPGHLLNSNLKYPLAKGYAFIEYANPNSARKAIEFFEDLKSLRQIISSGDLEDSKSDDAKNISNLVSDEDHKSILLCTVLSKSVHAKLMDQYQHERFQSLTETAKMLLLS